MKVLPNIHLLDNGVKLTITIGAADIIQLPISMNEHTTRMQIEREALRNYIFELWGPEIFTSRTGYESETDASYTPSAPRRKFVLAQRPKHFPVKSPSTDDSDASDLEGFTVVHRPKPEKSTAESLKDPFSSDDDWESDMSTYSSARKQDTKGKGRAAPSTSFFANTAPPPTRSGTPTQDRPHVDDDTASSDSDFTVVSDVDEEVDFMMDDLGRAG